jgi:NAD(P)-dependent dehydrogenase (short-subunit alcohol dehydrogenase family)
MSLKGKIAVVTGASRGIGRAIALRLAGDGAMVAVNYEKNAEAVAAVVQEIQAAGGEAFALPGDAGSLAGIRRFFQALDAELTKRQGGPALDILVNNAGIGRQGTVESTSEEVFDQLFAVNVKGPFFVAQQAIARLRDGGRVINLSSALSRHPIPDMAAYSMGKAAINLFTVILAAELGKRGITVNCIAPGLTVTDFTAHARRDARVVEHVSAHTALGRLGQPQDIAGVAAWLASEDAGWVTGQYIEASGGIGMVTEFSDRAVRS